MSSRQQCAPLALGLIAMLAIMPVASAREGQQSESAPSGSSSGSSIVGYQPIPNSTLPASQASQTSGTQAYPNAVPQQPMAQASYNNSQNPAGYGQVVLPQHGGSMTTPNRSGYDYTTYLIGQGPYTLGRDDVLQIDVRNQPEFSGQFIIGPDGSVQYSHLGDIPVMGMTKYEVQQVLEKLLQRYIRVPQVTVTILGYNSKAVYMIGELNRPGKYIMRGDTIRLREAVVAAGLPTRTAALWRTHIVYPDIDNPRIRKVNLKKILYKGRLQEDIDLYPGEIVVVPSTVLHSVNMFLSDLLNPFTRAASAAAIGAGI